MVVILSEEKRYENLCFIRISTKKLKFSRICFESGPLQLGFGNSYDSQNLPKISNINIKVRKFQIHNTNTYKFIAEKSAGALF